MKRSLEQAWREISTDLDEVLDLDAGARQVWLETLRTRDPDRAQRVRDYILDLEKLEKDNFLGQALPVMLAATPSLLTVLSKEQQERYATADAFADDLERYLRSEPILARGASSWYRARKFLVRNKLPVLAATATVIALIAALGIALWQAHVAREHAAQAQEISHFIGVIHGR
jgi:hypothetical protein